MNNKILKNFLEIGIISLFIISSVSPVVISYNHTMKRDECLENLTYICNDERGFSKFDYYKDLLLGESYGDLDPDKVIVSTTSTSTGILNGPMDSAWPMKCHDLHHTGRSPVGTADIPYEELWKFQFEHSTHNSPVVGSDGIIYVNGCTEVYKMYLYAFYPNGTVKWRYEADGIFRHNCPAIGEDGTIYTTGWDECLHAVNPNGTMKWKFDTGDNIVSSPAIGDDGTIYFGTMWGAGNGGKIFAVNPDGTEKWRYKTGYHICSDPAIGDDGTIYIGSSDDYLYALYPNGSLRWRYKTGDWVRGPPSIADDGTIYFGSWDYYLYALYPNGTLRWKTEIWYGSDTNPTIGLDGTIYISSSSKLFAIEPENGDILWEFNLGGNSAKSSPAICADGIIYIGIRIGTYDGGEIVAVNSDGTEHWRQRLSNVEADSSPAIGNDGTIYICSTSSWSSEDWGHLHAFGTSDPNAPEAPTISGETDGKVEVEYEYTFCSIDPNGDDVFYNIEWGDGEYEDWFGPYESGEEVIISHTWDEKGTYTIKARAKDIDNLWGPWGKLEVKMPVNQHPFYSLFLRFLDRFPNAFPMLRNLLGS